MQIMQNRHWHQTRDLIARSQYVILVLVLISVVLYSIPLSRSWLLATGIIDNQTILGLIGLSIAVAVYSLKEIQADLRELGTYVHSRFEKSSLLMGGPIQVNQMIADLIPRIHEPKQRCIDILGMTLDTAWPMIRHWIGRDEIRDCEIRMYCIDPLFAMENKRLVGENAANTAKDMSEKIDEYIETNRDMLIGKKILISLSCFRELPPIHGVMLGDGSLFLTIAQWIGGDPVDRGVPTIYEYFSSDDSTPRAMVYRNLFRRWLAVGRVVIRAREHTPAQIQEPVAL
jgi:hypothetical protein